jgi:hypothetical protein
MSIRCFVDHAYGNDRAICTAARLRASKMRVYFASFIFCPTVDQDNHTARHRSTQRSGLNGKSAKSCFLFETGSTALPFYAAATLAAPL